MSSSHQEPTFRLRHYPQRTCLYVGDQAAYGRYRQEMFQRQLVNEQAMTAQMNQMDWDDGPWGGPFF